MSLPNNIGNIGTRLPSRDETRCVAGMGGRIWGTRTYQRIDRMATQPPRTTMNFDAGECQPVWWCCSCGLLVTAASTAACCIVRVSQVLGMFKHMLKWHLDSYPLGLLSGRQLMCLR